MKEKDSEKEYASQKLEQRGNSYSGDDEEQEAETSRPRPSLLPVLIFGIGAGLLSVIVNIAITLLNLPIFQRVIQQGQHVTYNDALAEVGLQCLSFFVTLLICFVGGYLVGKFVVQRRSGFYAGMLAGVIIYLSGFIVNYIPNYPGKFTPDIITALVFLCIWSLIGGLISLLGAWIATRRHPYYARSI